MAEKKIPGMVWIVIGSAMVLMSVFIDVEKLLLFILAGAVFIVVGFFKIVIKLDTERKEREKHARHAHHASHHAAHHPAHQAQHPPAEKPTAYEKKTETAQVVRCSNCNVKLHHMFKFCPNCGQKLK